MRLDGYHWQKAVQGIHSEPSFPGNSREIFAVERTHTGKMRGPPESTTHHKRHLNASTPVVNPVGSRRSQHARKSSTPIKKTKPPRNEKDEHVLGSFGLHSFLHSFHHPNPLHPWYFNMSGASVLAGAHHFVASNNMFNTANTVSSMVIL